jgi:hypothetical protein
MTRCSTLAWLPALSSIADDGHGQAEEGHGYHRVSNHHEHSQVTGIQQQQTPEDEAGTYLGFEGHIRCHVMCLVMKSFGIEEQVQISAKTDHKANVNRWWFYHILQM